MRRVVGHELRQVPFMERLGGLSFDAAAAGDGFELEEHNAPVEIRYRLDQH